MQIYLFKFYICFTDLLKNYSYEDQELKIPAMSHHLLLILHLLGSAIWVGGHLILSFIILPEVLRKKDPEILLKFEKKYERIGLPALLVMVITGIWMAYQLGVNAGRWFHFADPVETVVSLKLSLLFITVWVALSANIFVLPKIRPQSLSVMAFHIWSVTLLGAAMMVVGSFVRFGGINLQ